MDLKIIILKKHESDSWCLLLKPNCSIVMYIYLHVHIQAIYTCTVHVHVRTMYSVHVHVGVYVPSLHVQFTYMYMYMYSLQTLMTSWFCYIQVCVLANVYNCIVQTYHIAFPRSTI